MADSRSAGPGFIFRIEPEYIFRTSLKMLIFDRKIKKDGSAKNRRDFSDPVLTDWIVHAWLWFHAKTSDLLRNAFKFRENEGFRKIV